MSRGFDQLSIEGETETCLVMEVSKQFMKKKSAMLADEAG
jgi:hypothetical protein